MIAILKTIATHRAINFLKTAKRIKSKYANHPETEARSKKPRKTSCKTTIIRNLYYRPIGQAQPPLGAGQKNDCKWEKIKNNECNDKHYEKTIFAIQPVARELSSKLKAVADRRMVGLWPLVKWKIKLAWRKLWK